MAIMMRHVSLVKPESRAHTAWTAARCTHTHRHTLHTHPSEEILNSSTFATPPHRSVHPAARGRSVFSPHTHNTHRRGPPERGRRADHAHGPSPGAPGPLRRRSIPTGGRQRVEEGSPVRRGGWAVQECARYYILLYTSEDLMPTHFVQGRRRSTHWIRH